VALTGMNKIALVTASILALGAASIAADMDRLSYIPEGTPVGSHAMSASAAAIETGGDEVRVSMIERKIRLVTSTVRPVKSCDAAHWPYYPTDCLSQPDPAGL